MKQPIFDLGNNRYFLIFRKILIFLGIVGMVGGASIASYRQYHFHFYGNSTRGEIDSLDGEYFGDSTVHYSFTVGGSQFHGSYGYDARVKPKVGERYLVKYSTKNPDINKMIYRE